MRSVRAALFVAGIGLLAWLIARLGPTALASALTRLTWWELVLVCLPYGLIMAVDTLGWRYAFANTPPSYLRLVAARTAGEALNIVTALGSVGGEAVKVWLLRPAISYAESVPSIVIAKTTSTIAQVLFLALGLILAKTTVTNINDEIVSAMLGLVALETLLVGGFLGTQLAGLVRRAGRLLAWAGLLDKPAQAERLDANLRRFYSRRWPRFLLSVAFHLGGWMLGVLETMVILWVLGMPVGVGTAAVIEAVGSGVRFASFLVPGSMGVLEGANAGLFAGLGLGAGGGLAFTLVRRARQIVWIGLGLLVLVGARVQAMSAGPVPRRATHWRS
jgi:uncharacterized protein (TIRG00374 family)